MSVTRHNRHPSNITSNITIEVSITLPTLNRRRQACFPMTILSTLLLLASMLCEMTSFESPGFLGRNQQRPTVMRIFAQSDTSASYKVPTFKHDVSLPESEYSQVLVSKLEVANDLREFWDAFFRDPRQPDANRFSWDPWYVEVGDGKFGEESKIPKETNMIEGEKEATRKQIQYSLKRIQTSTFFSEELYDRLVDDLVDLGSSVGLTAITPPWISLYTDGDKQNFHTDATHGPLAFVLSLCKENEFQGGETMMFQPRMMEYWRGFDGNEGLECGSIIRFIPPTPLGRCLAFDPRIPHGVNRVAGTKDPRKGRVVIHGWFNGPEICWFGPWDEEGSQSTILDAAIQPLIQALGTGEIGRVMGYLAVRLEIDEDGLVEEVKAVCDTLQADWDDFRGIIGYDEAERPVMEDAVSDVRLTTFEALKELVFDEGMESRAVVVPFLFE